MHWKPEAQSALVSQSPMHAWQGFSAEHAVWVVKVGKVTSLAPTHAASISMVSEHRDMLF